MLRIARRLRRRLPPDTLCHLTARSLSEGPADDARRETGAQKRRSGLTVRIRSTPVVSIFAHEATVVGTLRAFFRAANRRPALQKATALFMTCTPKFRIVKSCTPE